jgi:hypothetical protein
MPKRRTMIGVIGSGLDLQTETYQLAYEVGRHIAGNDAYLVCGGLGGIMEAAAKGACENRGTVIGVIPSDNKADANPFIDIVVPTGMGDGRNLLVVRMSDVLIAFPGSFGTLSEIALALNQGKTVVYLPGSWDLQKIAPIDVARFKPAYEAGQAVGFALNAVR